MSFESDDTGFVVGCYVLFVGMYGLSCLSLQVANLGGTLGLFLGFSFISLWDFGVQHLGILGYLCRCPDTNQVTYIKRCHLKNVLKELFLNLSSQGEERLKVNPITGFARNPVTTLFLFPTLSRFSKNIKDKQILKSLFFQIAKEIIQ